MLFQSYINAKGSDMEKKCNVFLVWAAKNKTIHHDMKTISLIPRDIPLNTAQCSVPGSQFDITSDHSELCSPLWQLPSQNSGLISLPLFQSRGLLRVWEVCSTWPRDTKSGPKVEHIISDKVSDARWKQTH